MTSNRSASSLSETRLEQNVSFLSMGHFKTSFWRITVFGWFSGWRKTAGGSFPLSNPRSNRMTSSGLCLFCLFIFQDLDFTKPSHSTWTTFSGGGHIGIRCKSLPFRSESSTQKSRKSGRSSTSQLIKPTPESFYTENKRKPTLSPSTTTMESTNSLFAIRTVLLISDDLSRKKTPTILTGSISTKNGPKSQTPTLAHLWILRFCWSSSQSQKHEDLFENTVYLYVFASVISAGQAMGDWIL